MENRIPCEKCPAKFDKSKSHCCGIIPFPMKFLETHKQFFKESGELKDNGEQAIILTKDFLCVFYDRKEHKCAIYDERPEICRKYGTIPQLECPYFKRSGNRRSPASEKITLKKIGKYVDGAMKKCSCKGAEHSKITSVPRDEKTGRFIGDNLPVMPWKDGLNDKQLYTKEPYDFGAKNER